MIRGAYGGYRLDSEFIHHKCLTQSNSNLVITRAVRPYQSLLLLVMSLHYCGKAASLDTCDLSLQLGMEDRNMDLDVKKTPWSY